MNNQRKHTVMAVQTTLSMMKESSDEILSPDRLSSRNIIPCSHASLFTSVKKSAARIFDDGHDKVFIHVINFPYKKVGEEEVKLFAVASNGGEDERVMSKEDFYPVSSIEEFLEAGEPVLSYFLRDVIETSDDNDPFIKRMKELLDW